MTRRSSDQSWGLQAYRKGRVRLFPVTDGFRCRCHCGISLNCLLAYKGAALTEANVPFIGIQNVEEHIRRRRPWNRGLGPAALKGYGHILSSRVQQLVNTLEQQQGPVLLGRWIKYFA